MPEVKIIRTQNIVVEGVGQNTYGDLTFTDKEKREYKISAKRKQYFEKVIIPGEAVQLNYSTAYNKEYIYSATQVKDFFSEAKPASLLAKEAIKLGAEIAPSPTKKEMTKDDWAEKDRITRKSIERQTALNAAVEVAKMKASDSTDKIIATAKMFEAYIEGKEDK